MLYWKFCIIMDENLVDDVSIVGNGNVSEKERDQMVFDLMPNLMMNGEKQGGQ